jgi:hypothetical protein
MASLSDHEQQLTLIPTSAASLFARCLFGSRALSADLLLDAPAYEMSR